MNMRNDIVESDADAVNSPFCHKPLVRSIQRALVPGLLAGLASVPLAAAPNGGQVRAGNAAITHDATRGITTIKQHSQRTAIDWRSFDVGPREQVRFKQPNAKATATPRRSAFNAEACSGDSRPSRSEEHTSELQSQ